MYKKTLSSGVIVKSKDKFLLGHATNNNFFDIFKGHTEYGELPQQAALRELYEEANIDIRLNELIEVGFAEYNQNKDLHLFILECSDEELERYWENCCCTSMITTSIFRDGKKIKARMPEIDYYVIVDKSELHEYLFPNLYKTLTNIGLTNDSK